MRKPAETVVVIHGLYMNVPCLYLLARRLRQAGYATVGFPYPSVRASTPANARALANLMTRLDAPAVHLVAHSLGGLIVRYLVAQFPDLPPGRVVTLGTPHRGSCVARALGAGRLRGILGQSLDQGLAGDLPPWPPERELGSLAGSLNAGVGRLLTDLPVPADGTVAVAETMLDGMTDHLCLPVTHTGLLLSPAAAEQVCAFLANGRFRR